MDGQASDTVSSHDARGKFAPGNTEYRRRLIRVTERLAELRQQYEDSPLLPLVAKHLVDAERLRHAVMRQRASNSAARLLARIQRKAEPTPQLETIADLERRQRPGRP